MKTFVELGILPPFLTALAEGNITEPSEIQEKAIPILLKQNTDFIGQAQTGTGKTLAFSLPLLQKVHPENPAVQALILAPTRELCQQIAKQIFKMTKHTEGIYVTAVYGGENIDLQLAKLRKPTQIIVATPGRLIDLLERKAVNLEIVETVVLDEADEMISMGFKQELDHILNLTNQQSFTWLFSATMSEEIKALVSNYLSVEAIHVQIQKKELINKGIEHQYYICPDDLKFQYLLAFLKTQPKKIGIIFCKTKAATQQLTKQLIAKNFIAEALHGDLEQRDRDKVMRKFKSHTLQMLVATDISARGIDVDDLAYVVHYQLPDQLEYYTHRSGRTARAGKRGISLAFVNTKEVRRIRMIETQLGISFRKL
jgi:ATP-dependent RNA helicase DeaD